MKLSVQKLLILSITLEGLLLIVCYLLHPELKETFRFAARYSGRLSAFVFLFSFYRYTMDFPKVMGDNMKLRHLIQWFAILHVIHFGFLAMNIYLNEIELIPYKLAGGVLAYLMIVVAPFKLHQMKVSFQLAYFYYVTFVMIMTYVARAKGDFEGAAPYWLHYVALGVFVVCAIAFGIKMWLAKQKIQKVSS